MIHPIEFDTQRLRLRQWRDSDRAPFAAMNSDRAVMQYFPSTLSRQASDSSIDAWQAHFAQRGWSDWAVELRATGEFTGCIGLSVPVRVLPFSPGVKIGWRLARAHLGNGVATEGASGAGHARRDDAAVMLFHEGVSLPKAGGRRRARGGV